MENKKKCNKHRNTSLVSLLGKLLAKCLQQVEKFKYPGFDFTSDGRRNKNDTRIGMENAVLREFHRSVVTKHKVSRMEKLLTCKFYFSIFACGNESWVMTEKPRSSVQAAEMVF